MRVEHVHDQEERLTVHIVDEIERSLHDLLGGTVQAVRRTNIEVVHVEPARHTK